MSAGREALIEAMRLEQARIYGTTRRQIDEAAAERTRLDNLEAEAEIVVRRRLRVVRDRRASA